VGPIAGVKSVKKEKLASTWNLTVAEYNNPIQFFIYLRAEFKSQ
jgi:hypothetical protein